jgi:NadR type nicotinamide-nucleotide adenylyltransferase
MLKKVVVIGPESTGKSTLCEELARHYNTFWCPEYAREYLTIHGTEYNYDDLLTIAKGQIQWEEDFEARVRGQMPEASYTLTVHSSQLLFIDTDMYVMKVWCQFVFGKCHQFILDQIKNRKYDLYFLCNTDLEWVPDELREYPDLATREKLYDIYKTLMQGQPTPWIEISGNSEQRLRTAIEAVNTLLNE